MGISAEWPVIWEHGLEMLIWERWKHLEVLGISEGSLWLDNDSTEISFTSSGLSSTFSSVFLGSTSIGCGFSTVAITISHFISFGSYLFQWFKQNYFKPNSVLQFILVVRPLRSDFFEFGSREADWPDYERRTASDSIEFCWFTLKTLNSCALKALNRQSHVRNHQQNLGLVQIAVLERRWGRGPSETVELLINTFTRIFFCLQKWSWP